MSVNENERGSMESVVPHDAAGGRARPNGPPAGGRLSRTLLSALFAALVAAILVWNLPDSRFRRALLPAARPLVLGLGLQQHWEVFSPNPPGHSEYVDVVVRRQGGGDVRTTLPGSDPFLGALRDYRWRKWARRMSEDRRQQLWSSAAAWFARRHGPAESVVLHRRASATPEPGAARRWKTFPFFELRLPPGEGP